LERVVPGGAAFFCAHTFLTELIAGPLEEKHKFYLFLALVYLKLPHYAADRAIQAGYGGHYQNASVSLSNVKLGKVPNLPDLCALVNYLKPEFNLPGCLLPAGTFTLVTG
jgi:hypothetical protein